MTTVRWRAPGGWVVDTIHLTATTRPGDAGSWYRLARDGVFVAQVRTVAALTEFVNLADLTEENPS